MRGSSSLPQLKIHSKPYPEVSQSSSACFGRPAFTQTRSTWSSTPLEHVSSLVARHRKQLMGNDIGFVGAAINRARDLAWTSHNSWLVIQSPAAAEQLTISYCHSLVVQTNSVGSSPIGSATTRAKLFAGAAARRSGCIAAIEDHPAFTVGVSLLLARGPGDLIGNPRALIGLAVVNDPDVANIVVGHAADGHAVDIRGGVIQQAVIAMIADVGWRRGRSWRRADCKHSCRQHRKHDPLHEL